MCIGEFPLNDAVHLPQLLHQILLIMKSSGSITQENIHMSRLGSIDRIEDNTCRVGAFCAADNINPCTVSPLR